MHIFQKFDNSFLGKNSTNKNLIVHLIIEVGLAIVQKKS